MSDVKVVKQITSLPGIKRDGTSLDGDQFNDCQWVRFQRGRPKKMGGYQQITDRLNGPIRSTYVWSRANVNAIHNFTPYGIEVVTTDVNGLGNLINDRTPSGFTYNQNALWTTDSQFDAAVGSTGTVILAHCSSSMVHIDDNTASKPYLGIAATNALFTQIADAPAVSGGVFAVAPYTFVHGSDGLLAWSDANQPQVWATSAGNIGDAGTARITGAKIVKGLPLRSGSGAAALLWSLDSVIRMDQTGGAGVFKFSHLTTQSSILAQNSVIEYDGIYFWIGIDRFLMSDGGKVSELPNQLNINWFFDNLNFNQRQKVWAMKVPRFGEIWWFFPFGDAEECTHAVIYNVREQTWYDTRCDRSAGYYSQVFKYPVMAKSTESGNKRRLTLSTIVGTISIGDALYGVTSGANGIVTYINGNDYTVSLLAPFTEFIKNEPIDCNTSGATAVLSVVRPQYELYLHEKGRDAVMGDQVTAIESYFETCDFGMPTGGSQPNQVEGENRWTRVTRVEPDFLQDGTINIYVTGKEFANSENVISEPYPFTNKDGKVDIREQRREIRLKFVSNEVNGHFEMGRVILHLAPGDRRS